MSMPSAFELGGAIGSNVAGGIRGAQENTALDQILQQAIQSNDPQVQQDIMRQILTRVSPEKQPAALQVLQNRTQQMQRQNEQKAYENIATRIEGESPNTASQRLIASVYRSPLNPEQKEKIVKNLTSAVPYRAEQQQRLALDSVLKRYNSRIKELDSEIKTSSYKNRAQLKAQKKALQDERDYLLNFESLNKINEEQKVKFDPNNPEHLKIFEDVDIEFGGDRDKINAALSERFSL